MTGSALTLVKRGPFFISLFLEGGSSKGGDPSLKHLPRDPGGFMSRCNFLNYFAPGGRPLARKGSENPPRCQFGCAKIRYSSIPNSKNQLSKSKKPFSGSKKPCSPPLQIKNGLRRLHMKNGFFKKSSPKHVYTNVLATC